MKPWARILLSTYFVIHGITMSVSLFRETPYGELLHTWTDPWQWTVGMHQNWEMFVPDPRVKAAWLEMEGIRPDGTRVPLALPHQVPDPAGALLVYDRGGKLVRNAVVEKQKKIRASFVRWACREHGDLARVAFTSVAVVTPPPGLRAEYPRSSWRGPRKELESWRCKR